ncbi:MAG: DUF3995 domain-containing protein, partial [Acidobacteriota bacterium]
GGTIGIAVAIPTVNGVRVFSPSVSATLLVALALFAASLISAGSVGWLGKSIPPAVYRVLLSLVGLAFVVRTIGDFRLFGFFKPANSSAFAFYDTVFYSPLCLFIASAAFLVAIRRK